MNRRDDVIEKKYFKTKNNLDDTDINACLPLNVTIEGDPPDLITIIDNEYIQFDGAKYN